MAQIQAQQKILAWTSRRSKNLLLEEKTVTITQRPKKAFILLESGTESLSREAKLACPSMSTSAGIVEEFPATSL
jgi:hypothetical protein